MIEEREGGSGGGGAGTIELPELSTEGVSPEKVPLPFMPELEPPAGAAAPAPEKVPVDRAGRRVTEARRIASRANLQKSKTHQKKKPGAGARPGAPSSAAGAAGEESAAPEEGLISDDELKAFADALGLALDLTGQLIAHRRGPHWKFSPPERQMFGAAWAEALAPWAGSLGKWLPLATALTVTAGLVAIRVQQDSAREEIRSATDTRRTPAERADRPAGDARPELVREELRSDPPRSFGTGGL